MGTSLKQHSHTRRQHTHFTKLIQSHTVARSPLQLPSRRRLKADLTPYPFASPLAPPPKKPSFPSSPFVPSHNPLFC